ncbi:branched-chain amino acid ABC transporter permease [Eoetvoesiella caeni]|uniref:Amino acid/amide ABC transporter membrane protein 2 (HAAT family) n=1 Tax=Eoetvoesiella caeni TaxID=645616 RepID=A0A366HG06_9BURK|nr:branched-chain amino acid ABC transporter permease [Eoetvoesiella caeni]MCI2808810.1 branched-chain amino acid ABC transporter permease [Eoetvoesiella caeni]NYT55350.1 branched-chain amino acid ABC transporter permease [Eoetvoesiella caeni]RBP40668.1 amino acid/amide ABC transporter membrane protein 2 (HAAT family) [Eoetvoesiella caeni]
MKARYAALVVVAGLLLAAVPWLGSDVLTQFGISALLLAVLAQGWNIIGGYTGYASFGNSVFYGLGSYGVGIAMVQWQQPFAVGLAFGVLMAVVFAVVLGLPVLRLRGHYFAIATLALAQVMIAIVSNIGLAGRNIGLVLPPLNNDPLFYELSLGLLALTTLCVFWLAHSRFGFGLIAIRENEEGAAVMGVNTTLYKVMAFALSGVFSALAGGIHAYWITFLDPESAFDISLNVKMIIMAVLGGSGTVLGPIVGAFTLSALSEVLASEITSLASLFFGLVIVVAVVFMPRGLADVLRRSRKAGWRYFIENIRAHRL